MTIREVITIASQRLGFSEAEIKECLASNDKMYGPTAMEAKIAPGHEEKAIRAQIGLFALATTPEGMAALQQTHECLKQVKIENVAN